MSEDGLPIERSSEDTGAAVLGVSDTTIIAEQSRLRRQGGAVWKLDDPQRQLDANVVALPPGDAIARHLGSDLDVLVHVVEGAGELRTGGGTTRLFPGVLVWLPRRTEREIVAGYDGLCYLSVHQRNRSGLTIAAPGRDGPR